MRMCLAKRSSDRSLLCLRLMLIFPLAAISPPWSNCSVCSATLPRGISLCFIALALLSSIGHYCRLLTSKGPSIHSVPSWLAVGLFNFTYAYRTSVKQILPLSPPSSHLHAHINRRPSGAFLVELLAFILIIVTVRSSHTLGAVPRCIIFVLHQSSVIVAFTELTLANFPPHFASAALPRAAVSCTRRNSSSVLGRSRRQAPRC